MAKNTKKSTLTAKERVARLEQEYSEVADRLSRLNSALNFKSEKAFDAFVAKVGEEQFGLLREQQEAMTEYRDILARRIQLFKFEHKGEL